MKTIIALAIIATVVSTGCTTSGPQSSITTRSAIVAEYTLDTGPTARAEFCAEFHR